MNGLKENANKALTVIYKRRRPILMAVFAVAALAAVYLGINRIMDYGRIKEENDQLQAELLARASQLEDASQQLTDTQERLTYAEGQVELYKESTNALTQQVSGLKAIQEDLNNQLEELLRVQDEVPVITRNELEAQISSLSELVTIKYIYRNASRQSAEKTWLWGWTLPFSDVSLLATYDGTITAGIDLKDIRFEVDESTKTIIVKLPFSRIFDHNIPQETINVLEVKNNVFNSITFNDYNKFISAEKAVMEQHAIDCGLLKDANEEAREVIKAFLMMVPGIDAYTLKFI